MSNIQLVSINGVSLPNPLKGKLQLKKEDKYNEYECEDGSKKIEEIRTNVYSGSVSYSGLFESDVLKISNAITLVSSIVIYSPYTNSTHTVSALVTGLSSSNIITKTNANAWSLSFDFEEIDREGD